MGGEHYVLVARKKLSVLEQGPNLVNRCNLNSGAGRLYPAYEPDGDKDRAQHLYETVLFITKKKHVSAL
jgi:hypothetical protein